MSDVELPMCFESVHSVPKVLKFRHFLGEVGGLCISRGGYGAYVFLGVVGGLHITRGGRGLTYFSGR